MINDIGSTEFQLESQDDWRKDDQESSYPRAEYKLVANFVAHDGGIVQRFTYSHVTVIGHSSEKVKFSYSQKDKKK